MKKINEKELEAAKKSLGLSTTLKSLYSGTLKEILIASNYPKKEEDKIKSMSEIYGVPVEKLEVNSKELGIICKKTFNVSILGILKEE